MLGVLHGPVWVHFVGVPSLCSLEGSFSLVMNQRYQRFVGLSSHSTRRFQREAWSSPSDVTRRSVGKPYGADVDSETAGSCVVSVVPESGGGSLVELWASESAGSW